MSDNDGAALLEARNVVSGYDCRVVVRDVCIQIGEAEMVAVLGHNGSGKSTLLKSVFGMIPLMKGEIRLQGTQIAAPRPSSMLRKGVAYMPQGHGVFDDLTVRENLEAATAILPRPSRANAVEKSLELFGELRALWQRRCRNLSGGERQMVAFAAAFVTSPRLVLLDEPTLGLAPKAASQLLDHLAQFNANLGTAMLIVEQRIEATLALCHRAYVMRAGELAHSGTPSSVKDMLLRELALDN